MPSPRFIHIDDSLTAIRLVAARVVALRPDLELQSYQTVAQAIAGLQALPASETPWLVLTDINMPGRSGVALVSWLRRHPCLHQTPVAVLSAAGEAEHAKFAASHGVIRWISKPASDSAVSELLREREFSSGEISLRETLEREFVASARQAVERLLAELGEGIGSAELFQKLHSLKGEAGALLFPDIADVAHGLETLVSRAREAGYAKLDLSFAALRDGLRFISEQLRLFALQSADQCLEAAPELLLADLDALGRNIPRGPRGHRPGSAATTPARATPAAGIAWDLPDFGIDLSSFERMQEQIKGVLRGNARVSAHTRTVAEADAQALPRAVEELIPLVRKLDQDCLEMAAAFATHFTVRGERITAFLRMVAAELARHVARPVDLELDINPELEIDQPVYVSLKAIFVHLIRNALDHGIEPAPERQRTGKPAVARLRIAISPDRRFRYRVIFEDDGGGIDVDRLRAKAAQVGDEAARRKVSSLSDAEALELIFNDDLSTKDEVTQTSGRGMGMGAIRQLIERHSGTVAVSSRRGEGTRFVFTLTKALKLH